MEIGVMYDDLSIVWIAFAAIEDLRKDGVLFIVLTTERGNRKALVTRLWDRFNGTEGAGWMGSDNYAVGVGTREFFVTQWNDGVDSLRVRSLVNPHCDPVTRSRIKSFPSRYKVHTFTGKAVKDARWKVALAKFETEMF